jgi:hypothetical protein
VNARLMFLVVAAAAVTACGERAEQKTPAAGPPSVATPAEPPTSPPPGPLAGDAVRPFTATVLRAGGATDALDSRATKGHVVYVVNSTTCPYCRDYVDRLKGVESKFMGRGVDVVHLYPNHSESDAEKRDWHAKQGFKGGQVLDADAKIAHLLEADHTPTVYVVDAKHVIAYRGAIDDDASGEAVKTTYLANAVESLLAGKPVEVASTDPPG